MSQSELECVRRVCGNILLMHLHCWRQMLVFPPPQSGSIIMPPWTPQWSSAIMLYGYIIYLFNDSTEWCKLKLKCLIDVGPLSTHKIITWQNKNVALKNNDNLNMTKIPKWKHFYCHTLLFFERMSANKELVLKSTSHEAVDNKASEITSVVKNYTVQYKDWSRKKHQGIKENKQTNKTKLQKHSTWQYKMAQNLQKKKKEENDVITTAQHFFTFRKWNKTFFVHQNSMMSNEWWETWYTESEHVMASFSSRPTL